jgi:prepilin-type N-terminal cleavage/methylation domain-containing protein
MNVFYKKGITLMELIIVIAIIGILSTLVFSSLSETKNNQILKSTVEDVVSVIDKARSQTLASLNLTTYGVHFESNKIVLFSGTTYNTDNASNEVIDISSPANISNISFAGGATEFYFNRLSGVPSKTGNITISISSNANLVKTITISSTGGVSVN